MRKILIGLSFICGLQQLQAQQRPIIYQMLVRNFGNKNTTNKYYGSIAENGVGKFDDISDRALDSLKTLHITHIWYTGVIRHATTTDYAKYGMPADDADIVKGRAGSPYAIRNYYDVNPDLANNITLRKKEFSALIERTHRHGLKVIMDFIPNHVSRAYREDSFHPNNSIAIGNQEDTSKNFSAKNDFYYLPGTSLQLPENNSVPSDIAQILGMDEKFAETPAKATGNDVFSNKPSIDDWYETIKLNYSVDFQQNKQTHFDPIPPLWHKLEQILLYWSSLGGDGFRCDMVEMVPVEFWHWVIPNIKAKYPAIIFMGEAYNPKVYDAYLNDGHFDYLYDKTGMYDLLRSLITDQNKEKSTAIDSVQKARNSQHFVRFLENHDEQRVASKEFADNADFGLPAMAVISCLPKSPIMIYNGQEVGEKGAGKEGFGGDDGRTSIFDYWGIPAQQQWMDNGKFDGKYLSESQKNLRKNYAFLLNLVNGKSLIQSGNYQVIDLPNLNEKQFSFARFNEKKCICVIANFERKNPLDIHISLADLQKQLGLQHHFSKYKILSYNTLSTKWTKSSMLNTKIARTDYAILEIE